MASSVTPPLHDHFVSYAYRDNQVEDLNKVAELVAAISHFGRPLSLAVPSQGGHLATQPLLPFFLAFENHERG
jgi:hypothetical protein